MHGDDSRGGFPMTAEIRELFERQARWQRSRRSLSWAEKVRLVEAIRESVLALRRAPVEREAAATGGGIDSRSTSS